MNRRLKYLESPDDARPIKMRSEEPLQFDDDTDYRCLAGYDLLGDGPRPGCDADKRMYQIAGNFETRGERLAPILTRFFWVLVRSIAAFAIVYFVFHGQSCMIGGTRYTFL